MDPGQLRQADGRGGSVSTLVFLALIFFLMAGGNDDMGLGIRIESVLDPLRYQLSNYTAWLNGTESNFTQVTLPPTVNPLVQAVLPQYPPLDPKEASYYTNLTGFLQGEARFYNLSSPISGLPQSWIPSLEAYSHSLNHSDALNRTSPWEHWNVTTKVMSNLKESSIKGLEGAALLEGSLDLASPDDAHTLTLDFEGLHMRDTGAFVAMFGVSGYPIDIRHLSAYVPEPYRNATAHAIAVELENRLESYTKRLFANGGDTSSTEPSKDSPQCTFVMWSQLTPSPLSLFDMEEYEAELITPTGARVPNIPPPLVNGLLLSRNCAMMIELRDLSGLPGESYWRKAASYSALAFVIYFIMLVTNVKQMEWTASPASISKVSYWSFLIQAACDAWIFLTHVTVGMVTNNRVSMSLIAPGFLAGCLSLFFEMRYAVLLQRIQAPEATAVVRTPPAAAPAEPTPAPPVEPDDLESQQPAAPAPSPPTTTAATPPAPTAPATPVREPTTLGGIVLSALGAAFPPERRRYLFITFAGIFAIQIVVGSRVVPNIFAMYSIWVPQIIRNVQKGSRKALLKRYVIIISLCRTWFALYILLCPKNVLFMEPDSTGAFIIMGWMAAQMAMLFSQEYFGATWFLPAKYEQKKGYEYRATVPIPDAEAPDESLGDCSVCLEPVLSPRPDLTGLGPSEKEAVALLHSVSNTRSYCLAPCNHKFHHDCLEKWLAIKTICPVCRRPLPPL
ncbi:hypothetical protein DL93DRAFT_2153098 [Clavulina sp. PMI_390]|nr:hypothetical protein DL93DRAFT_2153098 [Clavulina sp. PMI_390]